MNINCISNQIKLYLWGNYLEDFHKCIFIYGEKILPNLFAWSVWFFLFLVRKSGSASSRCPIGRKLLLPSRFWVLCLVGPGNWGGLQRLGVREGYFFRLALQRMEVLTWSTVLRGCKGGQSVVRRGGLNRFSEGGVLEKQGAFLQMD